MSSFLSGAPNVFNYVPKNNPIGKSNSSILGNPFDTNNSILPNTANISTNTNTNQNVNNPFSGNTNFTNLPLNNNPFQPQSNPNQPSQGLIGQNNIFSNTINQSGANSSQQLQQQVQSQNSQSNNPFTLVNPNLTSNMPFINNNQNKSINEVKTNPIPSTGQSPFAGIQYQSSVQNEVKKEEGTNNPSNPRNDASGLGNTTNNSQPIINPIPFNQTQLTFGGNTINSPINPPKKETNADNNNQSNPSQGITVNNNQGSQGNNNEDDKKNKTGSNAEGNSDINNKPPLNNDQNKNKDGMSSLGVKNIQNQKIEDLFSQWKNDIDYQAEKYSMCSERLKNYELQYENEIESITVLSDLIKTIEVNSDDTVAKLKQISSEEDELLTQLNYIEQSLQSYSQEIVPQPNEQTKIYEDIAELSQQINQIGETIDDINKKCEPPADNNNQNNSNHNLQNQVQEGEMNKILNDFYYELRKIQFAEQALLSKLNVIEKDIANNKSDMTSKI